MIVGQLSRTPRMDRAAAVWFLMLPGLLTVFPLAAVGALVLLVPIIGFQMGWARIGQHLKPALFFGPLMLWMAFSTRWAPDPDGGLVLVGKLGLLVGGGFLLAGWLRAAPLHRQHQMVLALAIGLFCAALYGIIDLASDGVVMRNLHRVRGADYDLANFFGRGAIFHALILPPLTLCLWRRGHCRFTVALVLVTVIAIFMTQNLSAKLAVVTGSGALGLFMAAPRLRYGVLPLIVLVAGGMPLVFPVALAPDAQCWLAAHKPSALHRLMIWGFVAQHIAEKPLTGWGLDAARRLPGGDAPVIIRACAPQEHADEHAQMYAQAPPWEQGDDRPGATASGRIMLQNQILPLHPHNGALQIWLELGGIGMAALLGGLLPLVASGLKDPAVRPASALFAAGVTAALIVAQISFGIWQEWFLSCLILMCLTTEMCARLTLYPASPRLSPA